MSNTILQLRRSNVGGRLPNTTNSSNSQYINAGEMAVNMQDQILYTSNGTVLITVGANVVNQMVTGTETIGNATINVVSNSTVITIGNTTVNSTINSTVFSGTSANATNLNSQPGSFYTNATNLATGTAPTARLGSGTANSTTFLRGDQSWATTSGGGTPSGANTDIQFNDSGSFGGNDFFQFNKTTTTLSLGNSTVNTTVNSTVFSGTSNNANYLGNNSAVSYTLRTDRMSSAIGPSYFMDSFVRANTTGGTIGVPDVGPTYNVICLNSSNFFVNSADPFISNNTLVSSGSNVAFYAVQTLPGTVNKFHAKWYWVTGNGGNPLTNPGVAAFLISPKNAPNVASSDETSLIRNIAVHITVARSGFFAIAFFEHGTITTLAQFPFPTIALNTDVVLDMEIIGNTIHYNFNGITGSVVNKEISRIGLGPYFSLEHFYTTPGTYSELVVTKEVSATGAPPTNIPPLETLNYAAYPMLNNSFLDLSDRGNNLSNVGAVGFGNGGLTFTRASTQYLYNGNVDFTPLSNSDWTYVVNFTPTGTYLSSGPSTFMSIFSAAANGSSLQYALFIDLNTNKCSFAASPDGSTGANVVFLFSNVTITGNTSHTAIVYKDTNRGYIGLSVDGEAPYESPLTNTFQGNAQFTVGFSNWIGGAFDGTMNGLYYFNSPPGHGGKLNSTQMSMFNKANITYPFLPSTAYTNATNILVGTVSTPRLGSGTANSTTFLRGDQSWAAPTAVAAPAGGNTDIQFNDSGSTGGLDSFTFNKSTVTVSIGNSTINSVVNSTTLNIGNTTQNTTINSTFFDIGNTTVNVQINSTSFTGTSANATNLNSQPGSFYTNATNLGSGQVANNVSNTYPFALTFVVDGGGSAITNNSGAAVKGYLWIPANCQLTQCTLMGDTTGNATVDIWKTTYASFDAGVTHPVVGDSITAAAIPKISSNVKFQDLTLTGWTTTLHANDVLAIFVNAVTAITRLTVSLQAYKI